MKLKKYSSFLTERNSENDMWNVIPQSVKELHQIFKMSKFELYVVGGAVRDFIISRKIEKDNDFKPKDFDLATNATPDEVIKILQSHNYEFNLQGKSFGVVVVYTEDQPSGMEIATFREDVYGEKLGKTRNPDVIFSTIEKDVERRDIPFNAMFYDLDKREIVDLKGGLSDIDNQVTKFVGDANLRIEEDPLRILRLIRFAARYQFKISEETRKAILLNKEKLSSITKERIWEEFKKGYKNSKNFVDYLQMITDLDLWPQIFPGFLINTKIKPCGDLIIYLAQLFNNKINFLDFENKMVQSFRIEYEISSKVVFLINLLNLTPETAFELYKQKEKCKCNNELIKEWLKVNSITDNKFTKFINYKPSVSAEELMKKGFKGRLLGEEIKRLETQKFIEL